MIGDIFWGCASIVNEICGDPVGRYVEASDNYERQKRLQEQSKPSYRMAKEKMRLYGKVEEYEKKLKEEEDSLYPSKGLIGLYNGWITEYKDKLKLLS